MTATLSDGVPAPLIECVALAKSFGDVPVLRGVDLTIAASCSTAITGPSGSGKSTLMAVLGLLTRRDAGELRLLGADVGAAPSSALIGSLRRRMAWVPQLPLVMPGRTCLDNALVGVRARRAVAPTDIERAAALFAELGIARLLRRDVSVLSGGELQKVALIRALVVQPEVILADEPTASLDTRSTRAVVDALIRAADLATVVVASHDPTVTVACTQVIALRDGLVEVQAA